MRDVADHAGVGMMTVSRVLNGTARVRDETKERVYRALEELQYRPNHLARALRGFRSYSIGVIVPDLYDPFFASYAHAINAVAKQHSYSVLLTTSDESVETELEEARELLRRQVDGLIVIPACHGRSQLDSEEFGRTPIVVADRPIARSRIDSVLVENQEGAFAAVNHLIGHGHKRICFIGLSRQLFTMQTRLAGYEKAMQDASLEAECFFEGGNEKATFEYLKRVREPNGPTAVFAANGLSSRHALHSLAMLGVHIPDQLAFVGFDDFELADILRPALTVVRQPVHRLGQEAAEMLFVKLSDKPKSTPQKVLLPVELIVRRSCGCNPD
ncbi:MAG TPA: LacI family DNA-binding transcriptional regulator [Acidobacteriaceae bacterium]|jgi:LacI family transcriptional regulator|nr:LacI family DNA-binding transcriptional regulator [Acidobacteriaceae bacterium]